MKWRLRGVRFAIGAGAFSILPTWYLMRSLVPHIGGLVTVEETTVLGYSHTSPSGKWCNVWIHLDAQLPPDVRVCVETTAFWGGVRPEIAAIKAGGRILLLRRHNWLGDSVDVDPPAHGAP